MSRRAILIIAPLALGLACLLLVDPHPAPRAVAQEQAQATGPKDELAELKAELARLKAANSTAAAMNEVDYHSQNLWFAGRAGNWPLAEYYWQKVITHMRYTKGADLAERPDGPQKAMAEEIATRVQKSASMQVGRAIQRKDLSGFATSYRALLQGCYDCHKAIGMPYLRPRMPVKPHQAIINVDPTATWPE